MIKIKSAKYVPHPINRFKGNPLVEAIEQSFSTETLQEAFFKMPDYNPGQRNDPDHLRIIHIEELVRFMMPLRRGIQLAQTINATMLEAYMGREPNSLANNKRVADLCIAASMSAYTKDSVYSNTSQFTSAVIGMPGVGKTFTLEAIGALYEPIIYHRKYNKYQIPFIGIEMPEKSSMGTLADAIFDEIDKRFPQGNYRKLYIESRANHEQKLLKAFHLLQVHSVGMLHVDEGQNNKYDPKVKPSDLLEGKGKSSLTKVLITASNRGRVPLLISGTAELRQVHGHRMSLLRRMTGKGIMPWKPLSPVVDPNTGFSEFNLFLQTLWGFQFTKHELPYSPALEKIFWGFTAGIPDFVVKLYTDVQRLAIYREDRITPALLKEVAASYGPALKLIRAIIKRDEDSMRQMADVDDLAAEFDISATLKGYTPHVTGLRPEDLADAEQLVAQACPSVPEHLQTDSGNDDDSRHVVGPAPDAQCEEESAEEQPKGSPRRGRPRKPTEAVVIPGLPEIKFASSTDGVFERP